MTADGAHIAYQVLGDGPPDLVFMPGTGHHVELAWELPGFTRVFQRLASFSRLIRFDHRGTGLSDPLTLTDQPILEAGAKDMLALLDACGSERAVVVANGCVLKGWTQRQPRTPVMVSSSRGSVEGVR